MSSISTVRTLSRTLLNRLGRTLTSSQDPDILKSQRKIQQSPFPTIDIPKVDFAAYFSEEFLRYGKLPAVIDALTGKKTTFSQLHSDIGNVANDLWHIGLRKGDVVSIVSENRSEFLTAYLACSSIGVSISALNPLYTKEELKYAFNMTSSKLVFVSSNVYKNVEQVTTKYPPPLGLISFGNIEGIRPISSMTGHQRNEHGNDNITFDIYSDIAALPLSSGTTGLPKAVKLSHSNLVSNIHQLNCSSMMDITPGKDLALGVLPWFHIYGQTAVLFSCLKNGVGIISMPTFTPELFVKCLQTYKPTLLPLVPALMTFLAKHPLVTTDLMRSVRAISTGAASCDVEVINMIVDKFNIIEIRQGYGLTEASPVTHLNPISNYHYNTCGPSIPNTEWKVSLIYRKDHIQATKHSFRNENVMIIDPMSGEIKDQGQEGELCIRGPQLMKGYLSNKKETDDILKKGWLHSGDVGYCNTEGHLVVTDRLKELIKYKGMQIAPAELEHLLLRHPAIAEAAVVGIPCDQAGEVPRAYVVLYPLPDGVVVGKVAPHKQLRGGVEIRRHIPKSSTGKVLRRLLRKAFIDHPVNLPKE